MWEKLKSYLADDTVFFSLLLVLVGVLAFGLGRQTSDLSSTINVNSNTAGITLFKAPESSISTKSESTSVVASKSGTKYHLPSCPGAKQIKESNKLVFDSIELAEAAGYTPAANCADLSK